MSSSYINLGSAGSFQPSITPNGGEVGVIKKTLQIGSASILDATFDVHGNITLTDTTNTSNSITLYNSGSAIVATKLETSRAFSIVGDIVAPVIAFNGQGDVPLIATLQAGAVKTPTIVNGAVTAAKLSPGSPQWTSDGSLTYISPFNDTSGASGIDIGQLKTQNGSSFIHFHSSYPTIDYDAKIIKNAGLNGDFLMINNGTGSLKFQTGGSYDRMVIDSTGKVGIGTIAPTPQYQLHIETGTNAVPAIYVAPSTNTSGSKRAELLLGSYYLQQDISSDGTFDFAIGRTNLSNSIYIGADCRVGIGTNILTSGADLTAPKIAATTGFIGNVTGTASGNVIATGANAITIDASNPAAPTIKIASGGPASNVWPISITGNAATATAATTAATATTVSDASITASKLSGAQTGAAPIYGARAFLKIQPNPTGIKSTTGFKSGTYSAAIGTSVTVNISNHGLRATDRIRLVFTKIGGFGTVPSSATFFNVVSVTDANTFIVNFTSAATSSGTVIAEFIGIQGSKNVSSVSFYDVSVNRYILNFTTSMSDANYTTMVTGALYPGSWVDTGGEDTLGETQLNTARSCHFVTFQAARFVNVVIFA